MEFYHQSVGTDEQGNAGYHHDAHVDITDGFREPAAASCKPVGGKRGQDDFQSDGFHHQNDGILKAQP